MNEARIDKWMWAVRIFKTRTIAAEACKKGRISINGALAKAARTVKPGDVIQVRKPPVTYSFKVLQSIMIERTFFQNLRYRDMRAEYMGEKKPEYAGRLLSRDLHLTDFEIPGESAWVGRTLAELNFGKKYGIHVVSILRGKKRINIPGASVRLFPQDKIQVIATDEELNVFGKEMDKVSAMNTDVIEKSEMILRQFCVDGQSPFLNKTLKEAGIREKYHCLIAGVERGGETLHAPDPHEPFVEGDVVWVVGESADVYKLVGRKCEGFDMG